MTLRLPEVADATWLAHYAGDEGLLEGTWVGWPPPGVDTDDWASKLVEKWRAGWTNQGGLDGGVLIVDEQKPFDGIAFLVPRSRHT